MGYVMARSKKGNWVLACDYCSKEGGRRRKCPHGHCAATSMCKDCYAQIKGEREKTHAVCEIRAAKAVELRKCEELLLAAGKFLRVAAVTERPERTTTKVWFQNKMGEEKVIRMNKTAYENFPLGVPVTIEQYRYVATEFEEIGAEE